MRAVTTRGSTCAELVLASCASKHRLHRISFQIFASASSVPSKNLSPAQQRLALADVAAGKDDARSLELLYVLTPTGLFAPRYRHLHPAHNG